jgi:hypothetical protein
MVKNNDDDLKDFDFEDLDSEIALGDLFQQKDNLLITILKKSIFILVVAIIGVMVFYASFTIGSILFLSDNIQIQPIYEEQTNMVLTENITEKKEIKSKENTSTIIQNKTITKDSSSIITSEEYNYKLIAGTFGSIDNANIIKKQLLLLGFKPEIIIITKDTSTLYQVIAKKFTTLEEATASQLILNSADIENFLSPVSNK